MPGFGTWWCTALALSGGCVAALPPPPPLVPPDCAIGESLVGDWVHVDGARADTHTRLQLRALGERYEATLVEGAERLVLDGARLGDSLQLTERADGKSFGRRFYLRVRPRSCALRMVEVRALADGREEQLAGGYVDLLPFPKGAALSWAICSEEATVLGAPQQPVNHPLKVRSVSAPSADGPSRCDYRFDLYLDDNLLDDQRGEPARSNRGERLWEASLAIPYAGEHLLEIHRHRRCPGEEATLIGVSCARLATF